MANSPVVSSCHQEPHCQSNTFLNWYGLPHICILPFNDRLKFRAYVQESRLRNMEVIKPVLLEFTIHSYPCRYNYFNLAILPSNQNCPDKPIPGPVALCLVVARLLCTNRSTVPVALRVHVPASGDRPPTSISQLTRFKLVEPHYISNHEHAQ